MSATQSAETGSTSNSYWRFAPELSMWLGGIALLLLLWALLVRNQLNLLCALLALGSLLLLSAASKASAALCALAYLIVLGDLRRIVTVSFGQTKLDLLLLVAPALVAYLSLPLLLRLRLRDSLSKGVFALLIIMILEVFNPQQGGLAVGLSGALFYVVPVLWFWVGRQYASPEIVEKFIFQFLLPLAVLAGVLGLCQTFLGFLPYEETWLKSYAKIVSLSVGGTIRAFGFSVSASEYSGLLTIGSSAAVAAGLSGRRQWYLVLPLLLTDLFLASSRSYILKLLLAVSITWILRTGRSVGPATMAKLGLVLALGMVGIYVAATHFAGNSGGAQKGSGVANLVTHQTNGFAHPLDSRYSSAAFHGALVANGFKEGFVDPLGHGLGATTTAGGKFGGDVSTGSSELDLSDMFISLGATGGLVYLFVFYRSVRQGLSYIRSVPLRVSLPVVSVLSASLASWLRAGEYSVTATVFFLLGALVYADNPRRTRRVI